MRSDAHWIKGHYHCKECGAELDCWQELPFTTQRGVARVGGCARCNLLLVEYEKIKPRWFNVEFTPWV